MNMFDDGVLQTPFTLAARLLDPIYDDYRLTNYRPVPAIAFAYKPSGDGFATDLLVVDDPTVNFPYGMAVEPP